MSREEIAGRIADVMRDVFEDDCLEVTEELSSETHEEWDSLAQITLLVSIEGEFGLKFDTKEIASMNSVKNIMDIVESKVG